MKQRILAHASVVGGGSNVTTPLAVVGTQHCCCLESSRSFVKEGWVFPRPKGDNSRRDAIATMAQEAGKSDPLRKVALSMYNTGAAEDTSGTVVNHVYQKTDVAIAEKEAHPVPLTAGNGMSSLGCDVRRCLVRETITKPSSTEARMDANRDKNPVDYTSVSSLPGGTRGEASSPDQTNLTNLLHADGLRTTNVSRETTADIAEFLSTISALNQLKNNSCEQAPRSSTKLRFGSQEKLEVVEAIEAMIRMEQKQKQSQRAREDEEEAKERLQRRRILAEADNDVSGVILAGSSDMPAKEKRVPTSSDYHRQEQQQAEQNSVKVEEDSAKKEDAVRYASLWAVASVKGGGGGGGGGSGGDGLFQVPKNPTLLDSPQAVLRVMGHALDAQYMDEQDTPLLVNPADPYASIRKKPASLLAGCATLNTRGSTKTASSRLELLCQHQRNPQIGDVSPNNDSHEPTVVACEESSSVVDEEGDEDKRRGEHATSRIPPVSSAGSFPSNYVPLSAASGGRFPKLVEILLQENAERKRYCSPFWGPAQVFQDKFGLAVKHEAEGLNIGCGLGPLQVFNCSQVEDTDLFFFAEKFPLPPQSVDYAGNATALSMFTLYTSDGARFNRKTNFFTNEPECGKSGDVEDMASNFGSDVGVGQQRIAAYRPPKAHFLFYSGSWHSVTEPRVVQHLNRFLLPLEPDEGKTGDEEKSPTNTVGVCSNNGRNEITPSSRMTGSPLSLAASNRVKRPDGRYMPWRTTPPYASDGPRKGDRRRGEKMKSDGGIGKINRHHRQKNRKNSTAPHNIQEDMPNVHEGATSAGSDASENYTEAGSWTPGLRHRKEFLRLTRPFSPRPYVACWIESRTLVKHNLAIPPWAHPVDSLAVDSQSVLYNAEQLKSLEWPSASSNAEETRSRDEENITENVFKIDLEELEVEDVDEQQRRVSPSEMIRHHHMSQLEGSSVWKTIPPPDASESYTGILRSSARRGDHASVASLLHAHKPGYATTSYKSKCNRTTPARRIVTGAPLRSESKTEQHVETKNISSVTHCLGEVSRRLPPQGLPPEGSNSEQAIREAIISEQALGKSESERGSVTEIAEGGYQSSQVKTQLQPLVGQRNNSHSGPKTMLHDKLSNQGCEGSNGSNLVAEKYLAAEVNMDDFKPAGMPTVERRQQQQLSQLADDDSEKKTLLDAVLNALDLELSAVLVAKDCKKKRRTRSGRKNKNKTLKETMSLSWNRSDPPPSPPPQQPSLEQKTLSGDSPGQRSHQAKGKTTPSLPSMGIASSSIHSNPPSSEITIKAPAASLPSKGCQSFSSEMEGQTRKVEEFTHHSSSSSAVPSSRNKLTAAAADSSASASSSSSSSLYQRLTIDRRHIELMALHCRRGP